MTEEQEKLKRFYTYLYKNIGYKHAADLVRSQPDETREKTRAIINYVKGYKFV